MKQYFAFLISWCFFVFCSLFGVLSESFASTTYTYDSLNRVIKVVHAGGYTEQFTYDGMGNRVHHLVTSPDLSVSPNSHDFPVTYICHTSASQTFTVANSGTGSLNVNSVSLLGTDPDNFAVSGDSCTNQIIATGTGCEISVHFSPISAGTKTAVLTLSSNDPDTPTLVVSLTGTSNYLAGDLNADGTVNLTDVVLGLQVQSQITPSLPVYRAADINGNGKLDMAEVLYGLQQAGSANSQPVCGNGTVEPPEECDDNNEVAGDGCSPSCTNE